MSTATPDPTPVNEKTPPALWWSAEQNVVLQRADSGACYVFEARMPNAWRYDLPADAVRLGDVTALEKLRAEVERQRIALADALRLTHSLPMDNLIEQARDTWDFAAKFFAERVPRHRLDLTLWLHAEASWQLAQARRDLEKARRLAVVRPADAGRQLADAFWGTGETPNAANPAWKLAALALAVFDSWRPAASDDKPVSQPDIPAAEHDRRHRAQIDTADEVVVAIGPDGRIGDATASEIAYAEQRGKPVREHRSPAPTKEPGETRAFFADDEQPEGVQKVRDNEGLVWTYNDRNGLWYTPTGLPASWNHVVRGWGPLVEVPPAPSPQENSEEQQ